MNPLKNKSFFVNNKIDDNVSNNISYKNTSNNKKSKLNNAKLIDVNHRPSISTDFSLSKEFGNLMNINKNIEDDKKEKNLNENKNKLIKVNTKRNNYNKNLSLRAQCKTNKKNDTNFGTNELFKNISEINIFNAQNKENNIILKYEYNIEKILIIQKWWKTLFLVRKSQYNIIIFLIESIKKIVLHNQYIKIKKAFPSISYYFYKWNKIITKQKIIKLFIKKNSNKIKKIKKNFKK